MMHDLLLLPVHPNGFPALSVRWDEGEGTIIGRDAERALEFVHSAQKSGFVVIHPWPTSYRLSANPLTSRADMAAIFGQWYILPAFLADAMPVGKDDDDVDPGGVDVTY